jgi:hypothetical protein
MTRYQKVPKVGQEAALSEAQRITRTDFIDFPMTGLEKAKGLGQSLVDMEPLERALLVNPDLL